MENKMTNLKALNIVLDTCELAEEVREKIANIRNSYQKKAEYKPTDRKPSKEQIENENIKNLIAETMENGKEYSAKELTELEPLQQYSVNKISALCRILCFEGKLNKVEIKRKFYYSLA